MDVAVGPTSMLGVLTSEDFTGQPGLYLYESWNIPPAYIPFKEPYQVVFDRLFLVQTFGDANYNIFSVDYSGKPGWYQGTGGFPEIGPDASVWAWNENGKFYLGGPELRTPSVLLDQMAEYPFWYEHLSPSGEISLKLLFFGGSDSPGLFMASGPDFQPTLLAKDIIPWSEPKRLWR